jgi:signal transduction histidine kinase
MKHERENYELKLRLPQSWQDPLEDWAACERRRPTQLVRNIIEDALKARDASSHAA